MNYANGYISSQNITAFISLIIMVLTVIYTWRKLSEMTRKNIEHETNKDKEDAIWKTKIESKLENMDSKMDMFSRLEKTNIESIQAIREAMHDSNVKINKIATDLNTAFKRIDELRLDTREIRENVAIDLRRINERIDNIEVTCPKNKAGCN
jgi:outer membrane murein-binding lipoprotein Lpp